MANKTVDVRKQIMHDFRPGIDTPNRTSIIAYAVDKRGKNRSYHWFIFLQKLIKMHMIKRLNAINNLDERFRYTVISGF